MNEDRKDGDLEEFVVGGESAAAADDVAREFANAWGDDSTVEVPVRGKLPTARDIFGVDDDREVLTQTAITTMQTCPQRFDLRYQHGVDEPRVEGARWFGRQFHDAKEIMLKELARGLDATAAAEKAIEMLEQRLAGAAGAEWFILEDLVKLRVAVRRYAWRWFRMAPLFPLDQGLVDGEWRVLTVESRTVSPIVNPDTGRESQTFVLGLRTDETRERLLDLALYLAETKTASRIDDRYRQRLWVDFQISSYGAAVTRVGDREVMGALYDVVTKCGLRRGRAYEEPLEEFQVRIANDRTERWQRLEAKYSDARATKEEKLRAKGKKKPKKGEAEETDVEFEIRIGQEIGTADEILERVARECDEAAAPVTGLKTLQRVKRDDETVEDFDRRVDEWYSREDAFERMLVPFDRETFRRVSEDQWDATKSILEQRARGRFARHTRSCYAFNRPCAFVRVCAHGDGKLTSAAMATLARVPPHEELRDASADQLPETDDVLAAVLGQV